MINDASKLQRLTLRYFLFFIFVVLIVAVVAILDLIPDFPFRPIGVSPTIRLRLATILLYNNISSRGCIIAVFFHHLVEFFAVIGVT